MDADAGTSGELITCPGCDLQLPEFDHHGQSEHMIANHPEIIIERLRTAGMHAEANELMVKE